MAPDRWRSLFAAALFLACLFLLSARAAEPSPRPTSTVECGEPITYCATHPPRYFFPANHQSVYFAPDTTVLDEDAIKTVAWHVERFRVNPKLSVTLVGFAGDHLDPLFHDDLALRRAIAVAEAMQEMGVHDDKIRSTIDRSEREGIAPCQTASCSVSYRRVEFRPNSPAPIGK